VAHVEAVLPFPASANRSLADSGRFLGFFNWRDEPVALVDLAAVLGAPTDASALVRARVLVVRAASGLRGYVVESVDALQHAAPVHVPGNVRAEARFGLAFQRMIPLRDAAGRRNAGVLDLRTLEVAPPPDALEPGDPALRLPA
jgi:hypothetical protein